MKLFFRIGMTVLMLNAVVMAQSAFDAVRIVQDEVGFGSRAMAMGGAYTALANDYSAVYWNPGGLAELKKSQFFAEISHLQYNNSATFRGNLTDENQNYTQLRSLGYAFPLPTRRGSFVLALGYNRVKDFDQQLVFSGFNTQSNGLEFTIDNQDIPFDRNVFQSERINDEGGLSQWSIAAGIALSPNFNAGITLMAWSGESDYSFSFLQEDIDDNYNTFPGDFDSYLLERNLNTDYSAVGMKLGGLFYLQNGLKIGASVNLPVTFTVEEVFNENDLLTFDDGFEDAFEDEPGQFEYEVKTPMVFDAGVAFSRRDFTLSAAIRHRNWSQTRFKIDDNAFGSAGIADLQRENNVLRQDFRSTTEVRLGGEAFVKPLNAFLRGGYMSVPAPAKNLSKENDRKYISAGVGFLLDQFVSLDVTYLRGSWQQESEDSLTPGITTEDITTHRVFVGLKYRF